MLVTRHTTPARRLKVKRAAMRLRCDNVPIQILNGLAAEDAVAIGWRHVCEVPDERGGFRSRMGER
jgi:hypothetical protein